MPYAYSRVAAAVCKGDPVKDALKDGSRLSDNWLLENFMPNIVKVFGK